MHESDIFTLRVIHKNIKDIKIKTQLLLILQIKDAVIQAKVVKFR